jgi:uncharacterized membrane protein YczE
MKINRPLLLKRLVLFTAGIFVMALGVAFSVRSDLGVSPVTSLPFVLANITGATLGTTTIAVYLFNMLLQAVILRRDYKLVNLFQIAASFAFGYFTDAAVWLVSHLPAHHIALRIIYLALGISCVALGILLYLTTKTIALPTDGTVQAVAFKGGFRLHNVKMIYDCVSTALAIGLSLLFLRNIDGIGFGTVAAAVGVGRMLGVFTRFLQKPLERFLSQGGASA